MSEMQAVIDAARADSLFDYGTLKLPDGGEIEFVVTRDRTGSSVAFAVDTREFADRPPRQTGTIKVDTPDALSLYLQRIDPPDVSLWADIEGARIVAILNDHDGSEAGWADHRVHMGFKPTPEWLAWTGKSGQTLNQEALAEFLEEHVQDVTDPAGADLLEIAQTFHATVGSKFRRAVNTQSGEVQLVYEEDIEAKAGRSGETKIPREFTVRLAPYRGCDPVEVRAMFAFRVKDGGLAVGFRLLNLDEHKRNAILAAAQRLSDAFEEPCIEGAAPQPREIEPLAASRAPRLVTFPGDE